MMQTLYFSSEGHALFAGQYNVPFNNLEVLRAAALASPPLASRLNSIYVEVMQARPRTAVSGPYIQFSGDPYIERFIL